MPTTTIARLVDRPYASVGRDGAGGPSLPVSEPLPVRREDGTRLGDAVAIGTDDAARGGAFGQEVDVTVLPTADLPRVRRDGDPAVLETRRRHVGRWREVQLRDRVTPDELPGPDRRGTGERQGEQQGGGDEEAPSGPDGIGVRERAEERRQRLVAAR